MFERDPNSWTNVAGAYDDLFGRIRRLGMTPRQQELNRLYAWYQGVQYSQSKFDWDGNPILNPIEIDAVSADFKIPPGFVDKSGSHVPIKYRRPVAPYQLARTVIERFTAMVFSDNMHPRISVIGDEDTEDFLFGLVDAARLWPKMMLARSMGGAMGTIVVGFKFVNGKPRIEIHDPRWVNPQFVDREDFSLGAVEIRWMKPEWEEDERGRGKWVYYWQRRIIDDESDTYFLPAPVADGREPEWEVDPKHTVRHELGLCPVVWIQNLPSADDVYGECDIHGLHDKIREIDELNSMASRGVKSNCLGAETPFITSEGVRRFSDFQDGARIRVLTHVGRWRWAVVRCQGEQQLCQVHIGRGRNRQMVRATADHRWLLWNGEETTRLVPGDKLHRAPHLIRDWDYEDAQEQDKRYWAWGFAYGDGSVGRNGDKVWGVHFRLCGAKDRFVGRFERLGYNVTYPPSAAGDPMVYMADYAKKLPTVEEIGLEGLMAFVRGYLDADGSRNLRRPEDHEVNPFQGIQVTGEDSIAFVRAMFPMVGAYIVAEDDRTDQATNYGQRSAQTIYFSLLLGFSNSVWAPYAVRSIDEDRVEPVWCLEVEEDRSFVLPSGVVTGNCDPTFVVTTADGKLPKELKKGSGQAIGLPTGGSAQYVELQGSGPEAAAKESARLRDMFLETAQCVLDDAQSQGPAATATEIEKRQGPFHQKVAKLREQYGELGVKPLLEKMLAAVQVITRRGEGVLVPPKVLKNKKGKDSVAERRLGPGGYINLEWPPLSEPTPTDAAQAATAITTVYQAQPPLINREHAVKYIASFFKIEDPQQMLAEMEEQEEAAQAEQEAQQQEAQDQAAQQQAGGEQEQGEQEQYAAEEQSDEAALDEDGLDE